MDDLMIISKSDDARLIFEKMDKIIQTNEGSIVTEAIPIMPYADWIAYNKAKNAFEISDSK